MQHYSINKQIKYEKGETAVKSYNYFKILTKRKQNEQVFHNQAAHSSNTGTHMLPQELPTHIRGK